MKKSIVVVLAALAVVGGVIAYSSTRNKSTAIGSKTDLDRPLVVGLVSWPGYAGGIMANGGFKENAESIFTKKYGLPVRFVLIEDIDARGKAFAKGGPDGVDVVWSTVDFWASELPGFRNGGVNGKAILHVDWSRGGDAIVATSSIRAIEDLKGKKIALVQYTPSHWLLETMLRRSKLTAAEQQAIRDSLIFSQDVSSARSAFVSGQVQAAVVWEPDVKQALKLPGSHILTSTKDVPDLIADVMVADEKFIAAHPKAIEAFVRGWLDGVEAAKADPATAARLLTENEPLFGDLGLAETQQSLSWVNWPNLNDNARMFGLDGRPAQFDALFDDAGTVWQSLGVIESKVATSEARDTQALRTIYGR